MHKQIAKWFPASVLALSLCSPAALAGFSVQGGKLVEGNGTPFVMRGVSHAHVWYTQTTQQALKDIASTGANTVRIVLADGNGGLGGRVGGAEVSQLIQWCKDNKLIAVLEIHDATGYGDSGSAENPLDTVNYWLSADIRSALNNQEDYVIINIANEPLGNNKAGDWTSLQTQSIQKLRQAGIKHTIMVDAPNWGQDWSNTMRNNATTVFNADSARNTVFSVHMYESYGNASAVQSYLQDFKNKNLPLVIGEFGADHKGAAVDEDAIMAGSQQFGFGYLGWSWSGNNAETKSLDITNNFNVNSLSTWGNRLINGANGIKQTAKVASIFGGSQSSSSVSSSANTNIAAGKPVTASSFEGPGYEGDKAFDNNSSTRWASTLTAGTASLSVDLGAYYNLTGVKLAWEAAYASGYNIQVSSDNVNWSNLYTKTNGAGGTENISLTGQGRYLRINMTNKANANWGYSLWDVAVYGTVTNGSSSSVTTTSSSSSSSISNTTGRLVSQNGRLHTLNGRLVNDKGQAFQLRGMSSHGLQWFPQFVNTSSFQWLRDDWNANVVRLAMYTKEGGYLDNAAVLDTVWKGIDAAIANDLYVIVDWHILSDGNPLTYKEQAKAFFQKVTAKYGNSPNIIYEIANEPNGVDWATAIKPYANEVIPVIRAGAPDAFVIVGTAVWSQRLDQVVQSPLTFKDVAYTIHFYSCSPEHQDPLRAIVKTAADAKLPIFSTEWGNSEYTGNGSICPDQTNTWLNLLDSYGISWVNWSLSDKTETSAALRSGASATGGWSTAQLTDSGNYVRNRLRSYGVATSSSSSIATTSSSSSVIKSSSSSSSIISTSTLSCSVTQTGSWQGGYQLDVKVTNTGAAVNSWTVYLNYPQTAVITNSWNATLTGNGTNKVTATNVSYNGTLGSGASTTFGLTGNTPSNFTLPSCSGEPVVTSSSSTPLSSSASSVSTSKSSIASSVSSSKSSVASSVASSVNSSIGSSVSSVASSSTSSIARVDNPFVGAVWYVDPIWSAKAMANGGSKIANYNTAVWMDRIGAITPTEQGTMGLREHLDAAINQNANLIQVVIYDLPNRDCNALASNGELLMAQDGFNRYKNEYINPIVQILSDAKYKSLRIIAIIEPDSLPNLVTNLSVPKCVESAGAGGYVDATRYTLNALYPLKNVYSYVDIGHSGWLGWDDNLSKSVTLIANAIKGTTGGVNSVAGFISNTANATPLKEPFFDGNTSVGGNPVKSAKFYEWNPHVGEISFVQAFRNAMIAQGFPSSIGMLIDTSRNGWGGVNRPSAASTSTALDSFVNQSRIDRRTHRGMWCNQPSGIGERPTVAPEPGIDAYVWVKPPGESDGVAMAGVIDPTDPAKGFDRFCDPTYTVPATGLPTGALPGAPHAGRWFNDGFQLLMKNAYPPL